MNSDLLPPMRSAGIEHSSGVARLLQAVQELSAARGLAEVQELVRHAARELTGCDGATFVLRDGDMCHYADEDAIAPLWKGHRFPIRACVSGWTMINRDVAVIPDIYQDDRIPHSAYRPTFVKSLVMVPIRRLDPIGAIGNYWSTKRVPTNQEVALLQALADATSIAIENVQIHTELEDRVRERTAELEQAIVQFRQLSITDELTELNNRRGFYRLAEQALYASQRRGGTCALAYLDVDTLKWVNDEQGHRTGDAMIVDVAKVLRATVRKSDIIARLGGDEFCVLSADSVGDPTVLKDRIYAAFDRFNETQERPYRLSVSIGLAYGWPADPSMLAELLAHADELMYEEKRAKSADGSDYSPSSGGEIWLGQPQVSTAS